MSHITQKLWYHVSYYTETVVLCLILQRDCGIMSHIAHRLWYYVSYCRHIVVLCLILQTDCGIMSHTEHTDCGVMSHTEHTDCGIMSHTEHTLLHYTFRVAGHLICRHFGRVTNHSCYPRYTHPTLYSCHQLPPPPPPQHSCHSPIPPPPHPRITLTVAATI